MTILALKLLLTPLLIGAVTLAGRRWGAIVSGLLIGLPLTSAPISFILACEFGPDFASAAAVGSLAGQISNSLFCLAYIETARTQGWRISSTVAIFAFLASTALLNLANWQIVPALAVLLAVIAGIVWRVPRQPLATARAAPRWDIPARIVAATGFVVLLTAVADHLGAQLSGLISPFPVFSVVFAAFTQVQSGSAAASALLRGVVVGSGAYAAFFTVAAAGLPEWGIAPTYLAATTVSLAVSGATYLLTERPRRRRQDRDAG